MALPQYAAAKKVEQVVLTPDNATRATTEKEDLARRHKMLTLQLERADLDGKVRKIGMAERVMMRPKVS